MIASQKTLNNCRLCRGVEEAEEKVHYIGDPNSDVLFVSQSPLQDLGNEEQITKLIHSITGGEDFLLIPSHRCTSVIDENEAMNKCLSFSYFLFRSKKIAFLPEAFCKYLFPDIEIEIGEGKKLGDKRIFDLLIVIEPLADMLGGKTSIEKYKTLYNRAIKTI